MDILSKWLDFVLTPLHKGTLDSIKWHERTTAYKSPTYDPRALPNVKGQCVHVSAVYVDLGTTAFISQSQRCTQDAARRGRHGWLCHDHYELDEANSKPRRTYFPKNQEQLDQEVVESVLITEARAISRGKREVVTLGSKTKVVYLGV